MRIYRFQYIRYSECDARIVNSWLTDVIVEGRGSTEHAGTARALGTEAVLLETLYALRTHDVENILTPILNFPGTKLLLSCTDRTPLAQTLKQAFCFADLVIIVPATVWVSCAHLDSVRYAEFNYASVASVGCWEMGAELVGKVSRLIADEHWAFEEKLVTFLPMPAASLGRWVYPELAPHELPKPYSDKPQAYTREDIHAEALYALCKERLMAERLNALYLNVNSFTTPVFGDLTIGKGDSWIRSLTQYVIPDVSSISLRDAILLRRSKSSHFAQLSRWIQEVLRPREGSWSSASAIENLLVTAANLARDLEATGAGRENRLPLTSFVVGSGGPTGGTIATAGFLFEGGSVADLVRLIGGPAAGVLQTRPDSVFGAYRNL